MIRRLLERFALLPARQQVLAAVLAVTLGLVLCAHLVWLPLARYHADLEARVAASRDAASFVGGAVAEIRALRTTNTQGGTDAGVPMSELLEREARRAGVSIDRLQPDRDRAMRVWLRGVEFHRLMDWLDSLERAGARTRAASVQAASRPGAVDSQVLIERVGAMP